MEVYTVEGLEETRPAIISQGLYYTKIHDKHVATYGEEGANIIRDNIVSTFREAIEQVSNPGKSNNMLLVGKVQSGKTSNLELFTALAFDNGYNLVVVYGGYDNTLLSQTTNRFRKTFDIPNDINYGDRTPVVFSSDDSAQLLSVDDEIIEDLLAANKPIFLISMKRPVAMSKVNDLLKRIDKQGLKGFIIDDEGDQASLNTKKNKAVDASATYHEIVTMKDHLGDPLYLSVTATPQALIFLDEYSRLRPDSIRLIEPGRGYCGADAYHLFDSNAIEVIDDSVQIELTNGILSESLKDAIHHYIVASAIMHKRGVLTSEMIIHSHRTVTDHSNIYRVVDAYIGNLKLEIEYGDDYGINILKDALYATYVRLFPTSVRQEYDYDELWPIICQKVIKRIYIILKNSTGQVTQSTESFRKHKIYIGGDLLQRGVTFPTLVTTFFTRWAKDGGNMDTNLQRARWFGYRNKYIDLCKLFTSASIAREFTTLSEVEADLWEQFNAIQLGEQAIEDILIRADDTKQKPTRKNVAPYKAVSFKSRWIKQRIGLFDKQQITTNNAIVDTLKESHEWVPTSAGSRDNAKSADYCVIDRATLTTLIDHMQVIFDLEPFEKKPLRDLIETSGGIPVILMNDQNGVGRVRSFYPDNKIYALHQGADNKDKEKAVFLGDSFVIVDKEKINIQIHKIVPKKKTVADPNLVERPDYTQYMFAIYVPKEKKYFVKG